MTNNELNIKDSFNKAKADRKEKSKKRKKTLIVSKNNIKVYNIFESSNNEIKKSKLE